MGPLCAPSSPVRLGDYKLLRFYWAGENAESHYYELFDLKRDTAEAINLASYMPEKVKELDVLITQHLEETAMLVPIRNTDFSGNPRTPRSNPKKSVNRPKSYRLPLSEFVVETDKGSRRFQLVDQEGKPCKSAALVIKGSEWIQLKNLEEGRRLVKECYPVKNYQPGQESSLSEERYQNFLKLKQT